MRVGIPKNAVSGNTFIPADDYWVTLHSDGGEMTLAARGRDIRVKATRRRAQSKSKITTVVFAPAGGKYWSLVISTPKYGEWAAIIEYTDAGGPPGSRAQEGED